MDGDALGNTVKKKIIQQKVGKGPVCQIFKEAHLTTSSGPPPSLKDGGQDDR